MRGIDKEPVTLAGFGFLQDRIQFLGEKLFLDLGLRFRGNRGHFAVCEPQSLEVGLY